MTGGEPGQSILEMVRGIVTTLVDVARERIVPEARWDDILDDRTDFYGILSDTQRAFGIEIPDDDAFEMETVSDLVAFVELRGR